jgi:hypothetical protein
VSGWRGDYDVSYGQGFGWGGAVRGLFEVNGCLGQGEYLCLADAYGLWACLRDRLKMYRLLHR